MHEIKASRHFTYLRKNDLFLKVRVYPEIMLSKYIKINSELRIYLNFNI